MRAYLFSFLIGCLVGVIYAALRVRSPAPPVVALVGLFGYVGRRAWFAMVYGVVSLNAGGDR